MVNEILEWREALESRVSHYQNQISACLERISEFQKIPESRDLKISIEKNQEEIVYSEKEISKLKRRIEILSFFYDTLREVR